MTTVDKARTCCPTCNRRGKSVKAITIQSLVRPASLQRLTRHDGWRFCSTRKCATAYFNEALRETVSKAEVRVRIGQKETRAPRTVCYCFQHTDEEIEAEVREAGFSSVGDAIKAKCKQGLDRCSETNPQGSCCLGNVRAVEKAAIQGSTDDGALAADPLADCCSTPPPPSTTNVSGTLASLGAMASAILSSACCWLPLALLAFGISAGSVAGFLDAYRPWLLSATGVMLASAFYLSYFRKPACEPDGTCHEPPARVVFFNRALLWTATGVVLTFAFFPSYVGLMISEGPTPTARSGVETVALEVEGMTCEACGVHIRTTLREVPGVLSARVNYDAGRAVVQAKGGVNRKALEAAVNRIGYRASIVKTSRAASGS